MEYKEIPVNIIGGHYQSRSRQWNSMKCINMFIDYQQKGRSPSAAICWPGETLFSSNNNNDEFSRSLFYHDSQPYLIAGNNLYLIKEDGTKTFIANIPGSGRPSVASDGENVVIRLKGSVTYIKNRFILGGQGVTYVLKDSTITNLPLPESITKYSLAPTNIEVGAGGGLNVSIRVEDIIRNDAVIDEVKQVYSFQQKIYVGGNRSIQIYYLDTTEENPLKLIDQSVSNSVGVASNFSMANTNNYLYFLGNDNNIYRMSSMQVENITPTAISSEFSSVDTSEIYGFSLSMDGQHFYILQCINSNLTVVYSENTNEFTRLQTGLQKAPHLVHSYIFAYRKHLIADYRNGNVYFWDHNNYTSNGNLILRQIDTAPINGDKVEVFGNSMIFGFMDLKIETGVGNADFPDPKLQIEYSTDGGLSFNPVENIPMQRQGQRIFRTRWNKVFSFYDLVVRLRVTDSVFTGFHSASMGLQQGGY